MEGCADLVRDTLHIAPPSPLVAASPMPAASGAVRRSAAPLPDGVHHWLRAMRGESAVSESKALTTTLAATLGGDAASAAAALRSVARPQQKCT